MSAFLTLDSVSLTTPEGRPLFENLTLSVGAERTGLVGRNGSGKTTLLDAIEGAVAPARGSILRSGTIGRLQQSLDEEVAVVDALGVAPELDRLARITNGDGTPEDFEHADWTLETRLEKALVETGLDGVDITRKIASFSGGERTRIAIARLLLEAPDFLLLDEPTNNLDTEGRAVVMALIDSWPGGILVASHDRALLEHVDRIVELSPVGCAVFGGAWSDYVAARDAARARAADAADSAANQLKTTRRKAQQARERQDKSDARGRATRARSDQPKMLLDMRQERAEHSAAKGGHLAARQIGEAETALHAAEAELEIITPLHIDLPPADLPHSRLVLKLEGVSLQFGARHLFGPLDIEMRGPERVAISGPNGSGKTSLLKLITGEIPPGSGEVSFVTPKRALLDQHVGLLDPSLSLLEGLRKAAPDLNDHDARAHLARFAFRGGAALQQIATLSGGERLRAGLAAAFAGDPPDLLILDEPTNHLDIESIELLETTLKDWDGAILLISHDEAFQERIGVARRISLA